ncbi:MAG: cysteine desulfurase [Thermoplasmata archaeon]
MNIMKIRNDFPILQKKENKKQIIYFDNACMTLKPKQVMEAMNDYYNNYPACGERGVYSLSNVVTIKCEESREKVKRFLNAKDGGEIIFTKNTTEGINIVAKGLALKRGDVVLTTDKEHSSNLVPWLFLKKTKKIERRIVKSNKDNTFNIENFKKAMNKKVKLVSMAHTSNLDGYTIPAKEIVEISHDYDALVMLDGAQSVPHRKVDVDKLDADFLSFSIHKMCGPTGVGILYGKQELLKKIDPLITGGGTVEDTTYKNFKFLPPPQRFEAGLQNYAGIIGAGAAVDYITAIGLDEIESHEYKLNKLMTASLKDETRINIIGPEDPKLRCGILGFNIQNMDSHDAALALDECANIMIRSGMLCMHSWFNAHKINGCARASVYLYNTEEEVMVFVENVKKLIDA